MISAWGIEHGEVSKAFRKIAQNLQDAEDKVNARHPKGKNQPLKERYRENYSQWRTRAGRAQQYREGPKMSPEALYLAREDKAGARAMVTGIGNISRRAGRVLP